MKFLFASDSFKGSLTSERIGEILGEEARKVFAECETQAISMADGGEGTMRAVTAAVGGKTRTVAVRGPLGDMVNARYGILPGNAALIEMAEASGLCLADAKRRNPWLAGSWGTGQLIADALEQGAEEIIIAIGGSATNDGGMGAMRALGVRFLNACGKELAGCGADLGQVEQIDLSVLHPAVKNTRFTVMCDVDNPLLGPDGATWTFGAQKGASEEMQDKLEQGMRRYVKRLKETFGNEEVDFPGAGAAGGMGAALKLFLNAQMKSGVETVLNLVNFDSLLETADCVITGEGRIDWQSAHGKVVSGVARRCEAKSVPAVAIVGGMGAGAETLYDCGVSSILAITEGPASLEYAMEHAEELYRSAARRMFRVMKTGMEMERRKR